MPRLPDPTAPPAGIPIRAEKLETCRDVWDFVLQRWQAAHPVEAGGAAAALLDEFCRYAREQAFSDNKPVGLDYFGRSLSLRFQDGLVLPFTDENLPGIQETGERGDGVSLTPQATSSRRAGTIITTSSRSAGITGKHAEKK